MQQRTRRILVVLSIAVVVPASLLTLLGTRDLEQLELSTGSWAVGTFHIHSSSSHDCDVPLDRLVSAARELGLSFLVLTDHNNQLAGPVVRDGITVLSWAELSTSQGHVVQMGARDLPTREARRRDDILAEIRDLGGLPIVTHPSDVRRAWAGSIDEAVGIEIANTAAAMRRQGGWGFLGLLPLLAAYPAAPELTLAQLYRRDEQALQRWDKASDRSLIGFCGVDAHGRIDTKLDIRSWHLVLHGTLPTSEAERPGAIQRYLAKGRFHCVAGLFGRNPTFSFEAHQAGRRVVGSGESIGADGVDELVAIGPASAGSPVSMVLLRNGTPVKEIQGTKLTHAYPAPGTYRVEVRLGIPRLLFGKRQAPVIYSNRIRVQALRPKTSRTQLREKQNVAGRSSGRPAGVRP